MCEHKKIPQHPGYWMCKRVNNTRSRVEWNDKTDNLAPTLEESINLYLRKETTISGSE
jgi:hypothetical protein